MIAMKARYGGVVYVNDDDQAKAWEAVGYSRVTPAKKAPAKRSASSKTEQDK